MSDIEDRLYSIVNALECIDMITESNITHENKRLSDRCEAVLNLTSAAREDIEDITALIRLASLSNEKDDEQTKPPNAL